MCCRSSSLLVRYIVVSYQGSSSQSELSQLLTISGPESGMALSVHVIESLVSSYTDCLTVSQQFEFVLFHRRNLSVERG